MKLIIPILIFTLALSFVQAAEYIPTEVQRIIDIRDKERQQIQEQYIAALERKKKQYLNAGNFDHARIVDGLLKEAEKELAEAKFIEIKKELIGSWKYTRGTWSCTRTLMADGKHSTDGKVDGPWEVKDEELILNLSNGAVLTYGLPAKNNKLTGKCRLANGETSSASMEKIIE